MAARIESGFYALDWSITFVEGTGGVGAVIIPGGRYAHTDLSSVLGAGVYADLASAIETAYNAGPGTLANTLTVTYDETGPDYTLSIDTSTIQITAISAGLSSVLGISTGSAAASLTSTVRPSHVIVPELGFVIPLDLGKEADDVASGIRTEGGRQWTEARKAAAIQHTMRVEFEPRAAVFAADATASVPWTWEDFYAANRGAHPVLVCDDDYGNRVYYLDHGSARFSPTEAWERYFAHWHLQMTMWRQGIL